MQKVNTSTSTSAPASSTSMLRVYSDPKAAPLPEAHERIITARFRTPSRSATVVIHRQAWADMEAAVPSSYAPLLAAVLETAAKSILAKRLESMSIWPTEIDGSILSADAILSEANGANTDWLTREELAAAWEASATRQRFVTNPNYTSSKAYRAAVEAYKELVLKLAGKTSQYEEKQLDGMLAKLAEEDFDTELGAFMVRRIEQIRNKPARETASLDLL
jgi:hypothetical protein